MKKIIIPTVAIAIITSVFSVWGYNQIQEKKFENKAQKDENGLVHYASYNNSGQYGQPVDFSSAAENAVPAVVHIKTKKEGKTVDMSDDPFARFFGLDGRQYKQPDQSGSGSGVIISKDGYIVTNNHVVQGADEVEVTFNNRITKTAKVIGTDPATDLAVIKIDGNNYPFMTFGNSDGVKLGQWVLAVGYPLTLDATVTAGIVSAKSRNIGINRRNSDNAIESFIQTDAAVNPGNSGGALVNTDGLLIGINSAIASPTGVYAGYSYAIPSNLVRKVANDIIDFGSVKRGYLGAQLVDMNQLTESQASELGISSNDYNNSNGVYLSGVVDNSGAKSAGLKKGDFITAINDKKVNSTSELMEQIANYYPGDKVKVNYIRNGKEYTTDVTLKSKDNLDFATNDNAAKGGKSMSNNELGVTLQPLNSTEASKMGIKGGVKVTKLENSGLLAQMTGINEGFVITSINDQPVTSTQQVEKALINAGRFNIEGMYPNKNGRYYYSFDAR